MTSPVVVVTGASAGVGRAVAHRFAKSGARLGLIARDEAALNDVKSEIMSMGGEAHVAACDVARANEVFSAADQIARNLGPIDIWINDAMATVFSPVSDISPDEFCRVTEVTYLGSVYGVMAALRHMKPRDCGTIVQIGSALAYRGIPLQAAYCGAKHALRGFIDSLRCELIHDRSAIRITMVQLPAVNTPQFDWARTHFDKAPRPVPPVVEPEAIASAIFKAAHEAHREYWIGQSTVEAILGNMAAPGLLDHYLAKFAYESQERQQLVSLDRRDNLYSPVANLHRTRGSFTREATELSVDVVGNAGSLGFGCDGGDSFWSGRSADAFSFASISTKSGVGSTVKPEI